MYVDRQTEILFPICADFIHFVQGQRNKSQMCLILSQPKKKDNLT
jgi:hypothetical protein